MDYELIDGERVACGYEMPEDWRLAYDVALDHVPDRTFIDLRFRRFYYDMSVEKRFAHEARLTADFYARDWREESYPDFAELHLFVDMTENAAQRHAIIDAVEEIFTEFGYWMPASFYQVLVAPALRDDVREARMLRYSEPDADMARGWDASLHALLKAADIGQFIQATSSRHGFLLSHGCDCNHKTVDIQTVSVPFDYRFESQEQKWRQVMAFWWHMWWEYAIFSVQPNTLVGSAYKPTTMRC
jgi:hypothetical protein